VADIRKFQEYLRHLLVEEGVSMRSLSLAMGRDPSYIAQLLDPQASRPRALPTPADLRLAAPVLGVPFAELLEQAWDVKRADLGKEVHAADRSVTWNHDVNDLSSAEREEVLNFISYVRSKRSAERQQGKERRRKKKAQRDAE